MSEESKTEKMLALRETIMYELNDHFGFSREEMKEHDIAISVEDTLNTKHDARLSIYSMYNSLFTMKIINIDRFDGDQRVKQNVMNVMADVIKELIEENKSFCVGESLNSYS